MEPDRQVVIVGAGRAGVGVGVTFAEAGFDVVFLTRRPVPYIGPIRAVRLGDAAVPTGRIACILAVPDAIVGATAADLAARGVVTEETLVGHLAGALPAAVLGCPAAGRFSAHPLLAFPHPSPARAMPKGTVVMVEGDAEGSAWAAAAFRRAGAVTGTIAPERKARYHAAAVLASNLPAVLLFAASDLFRGCGVPDPVAAAARLMGSMTANVASTSGPSALTGPFVRGDADTVAANLASLAEVDADTALLYRQVGVRLGQLLRDNRTISEAAWRRILETLA